MLLLLLNARLVLSNPAVMLGIVTQILALYYHNKVVRNIEGI
jgi:hypothetical protein